MTTFVLPIEPGVANQESQVSLDGMLFRLVYRFNDRDSYWYLDIYDGLSCELLRAGVKIVSQWDILRLWQGEGRPAGVILAIPQGEAGLEANTLEALGHDVLLTYIGDA